MNHLLTILFCLIPIYQFAQSPNVVFILVDDMGWNGTSLQISPTESGSSSDFYETPNLQQLAEAGMTFSQAYAPAPKCSPTRCSLLTGESPARNSFTEVENFNSAGKLLLQPLTNLSIPTADTTIAEWLKTLGLNYRTAHFGKWHLGSDGPSNNGFDFGDGTTTNTDGDAGDGLVILDAPHAFHLVIW